MIYLTIIAVIAMLILLARYSDKRQWNHGKCQCGADLVYYDTDSQGGNGYKCSVHGFDHPDVWISWGWDRVAVG